MIRPIYRSFFGAAPAGADALVREYLLPNQGFFRSYVAFMTQGGMAWEDFVQEFVERWGRSPEDLWLLAERMAGQDVEALAGRGLREAAKVLGQEAAESDLYLCVGLEMSNAFMVVVGGEPTVGIGLEAYGRTFGTSHVAFEDLLHVITHELCHAVRVREDLSPLKRFFEAKDASRAFEGVPVRELAVEEGLAVAASLAAVPGVPPHRALFYAPEDYGWCEENAEGLLAEFEAELEEPLAGERYRRYFGSGLEGDDRPPRTGYFLGHALVRRHLDLNPALGLAEAVRLPAEQLLG